jgi:hypothetical protein
LPTGRISFFRQVWDLNVPDPPTKVVIEVYATQNATFPSAIGDPVSVSVDPSSPSFLAEAKVANDPAPIGLPPGTVPEDFPEGFFEIRVGAVSPGGHVAVTLVLPPDKTINSYWKFRDQFTPAGTPYSVWSEFTCDPATDTGAETHDTNSSIPPNEVILHFVAGGRGDDSVTPGFVSDPGRPAFVGPVAVIAGPPNGVTEQPRTFTISATGVVPGAALTFTIDWGDGTPPETIAATPGNGGGVPVNHVFGRTGRYTVKLTATDQNGVATAPATMSLTISRVALESDPLDPQKTLLAVGGSVGNDRIRIEAGPRRRRIDVLMKHANRGPFPLPGRIAVYGGPGNDRIVLAPNLRTPAWLNGGPGNDTLVGGRGPDVLLGGPGRDILIGGPGRNLLIGGAGHDVLVGCRGHDVEIGGRTAFDSNDAALAAIMAEWTSRLRHRSCLYPRIPIDE